MDHLVSSEGHFSHIQRWPPYFTVLSDNGHNCKGKKGEQMRIRSDRRIKRREVRGEVSI